MILPVNSVVLCKKFPSLDLIQFFTSYKEEGERMTADYIAGVIDGNGSYICTNGRWALSISTHSDNVIWLRKLLYCISEGKGTVASTFALTRNTVEIRIYTLSILYNFCKLVNGRIRGYKFESHMELVKYINEKYAIPNNLPLIDIKEPNYTDVIGLSRWASGLIDVDGTFWIDRGNCNFKISQVKVAKKYKTINRKKVVIREYGEERNKLAMEALANVLNVSLREVSNKSDFWEILIRDNDSRSLLVEFLLKYPLSTRKYFDFIEWRLLNDVKNYYCVRGRLMPAAVRELAADIKKTMNRRRPRSENLEDEFYFLSEFPIHTDVKDLIKCRDEQIARIERSKK